MVPLAKILADPLLKTLLERGTQQLLLDLIGELVEVLMRCTFARLELDDVQADLGAYRRADVAHLEFGGRFFHAVEQLTLLEPAEIATVLTRRVFGVLLGHLAEVGALLDAPINLIGLCSGSSNAVGRRIRFQAEENVGHLYAPWRRVFGDMRIVIALDLFGGNADLAADL